MVNSNILKKAVAPQAIIENPSLHKQEYYPRLCEFKDETEASLVMAQLGVDAGGISRMASKNLFFSLQVENLSARAANILKQAMLSLGAEAALPKSVYEFNSGRLSESNKHSAILSGTLKQFRILIEKLQDQSFNLPKLANQLEISLKNLLQKPAIFKCRNFTWDLHAKTYLMGVLNVTPDSFSDGNQYFDPSKAVQRALEMASQGADIIDIGGESSRPGATSISIEEENNRVLPVIEKLKQRTDFNLPISIDTYKPDLAYAALKAGASVVNDITALGSGEKMASVVAEFGAGIILMHMQGSPQSMQDNPSYDNLMLDLYKFFKERIELAKKYGIPSDSIWIDPGIGFGKTIEHNLTILQQLRKLSSLGQPILVGASRKSLIGKVLDLPLQDRLEGSLACAMVAVQGGAQMLRIHDLKPHYRALSMLQAINNASSIY